MWYTRQSQVHYCCSYHILMCLFFYSVKKDKFLFPILDLQGWGITCTIGGLGRHIDRYIDRQSTNASPDMYTFIGRQSTGILTDSQPMHHPICAHLSVDSRPIVDRYIGRLSADASADMCTFISRLSADISVHCRPIYRSTIDRQSTYSRSIVDLQSVHSRPIYRPICRLRPSAVHMIRAGLLQHVVPPWILALFLGNQEVFFFHQKHMLGTLDFTTSKHWAPFNFFESSALCCFKG